jgi:TolB-like protein/DNA-binding winged helix-turn-helix (wHTH) protein
MADGHSTRESKRFGVFEVDLQAGELRRRGAKIRLQEQPFQVLRILLEQPGCVVTREELQRQIWPADTFVDFDHGLNNAIRRLREALCDSAENPRFIETLSRRGYRFVAPVTGNGSASSDARPKGVLAAPDLEVDRWYRKHGIRAATLTVVAALLLMGLVLGTPLSKNRQWFSQRGASTPMYSVAVLPLQNLSTVPTQEYQADGLTDALITDLAQIGAVKVISRTSSMQYKDSKKSLPEIAAELKVDGIVEGTVQRSGDRVRVTAQLIDGPTDKHVWANSYEHDMRDIFALERDVAQQIAGQLQGRRGDLLRRAARGLRSPGRSNSRCWSPIFKAVIT